MLPPEGGAGPKLSPLPQTAAGGPSGNLERTGKLAWALIIAWCVDSREHLSFLGIPGVRTCVFTCVLRAAIVRLSSLSRWNSASDSLASSLTHGSGS
ncbi:hypothetical protein VULLAG_LOCUS12092 [Vulpes lagopus]